MSVIASSMAGRPIVRPAGLALIGTTSLYGERPSQYDRIAVPVEQRAESGERRAGRASGGLRPPLALRDKCVRYEYLGRTLGMGTFHFGDQTVKELALLLAQSHRGQQVNSVFGEGVNPRLRKLRDGLNALGLPANELLNHGGPRLVYGAALMENLQEYLLGIEGRPKYIVTPREGAAGTRRVVEWWLRRWVVGRVEREDVRERMRGHRLVHPIRHGARVPRPRRDGDQRRLFEE